MRCLCCGKELDANEKGYYHKKCIRSFFGTSDIPEINIDSTTLENLIKENINEKLTVTGVQKKLSLNFSNQNKTKLTIVNYPSGYILKPQVEEYKCLPEAEKLVMDMASVTGIKVVPNTLIKYDDSYAYLTKRIDRINDKKLAMEDFCQLSSRLTEDKYQGSYERCAKIIKKYSSRVGFDLSEFFLRIIFCYVTGNSDMHLKNFSLIETEYKSSIYVLSAAYDLLPVNIILPEDNEEMALTVNSKKKKYSKK